MEKHKRIVLLCGFMQSAFLLIQAFPNATVLQNPQLSSAIEAIEGVLITKVDIEVCLTNKGRKSLKNP